jgi:23S rRNA U2552 (ribose-2'-O)-methylase RlmE/FtsJ
MKDQLYFEDDSYPTHDMIWAIEMTWSHGNRMHDILIAKDVDVIAVRGAKQHQDPVLIYSRFNIVTHQLIPPEFYKHFHRMFYLPYSCTDLSWIFHHPQFSALLQQDCVLKVSASPKSLERNIVEMLLDDYDNKPQGDTSVRITPDMIHPGRFTHIINCVYSREESIFRWGIVTKEESVLYSLTSDSLAAAVSHAKAQLSLPPVCRAFYKMQEVWDVYFPKTQWQLPPKSQLIAVDVGASPGGWTQFLSPLCTAVLSIDPGELNPEILALPNVTHAQHVAEAAQTAQALDNLTHKCSTSAYRPIGLCVCDVNFESRLAAQMLATHILPYMEPEPAVQSSLDTSDVFSYIVLTLKLQRSPSSASIERNYQSACRVFTETICGGGHGGRKIDYQLVHLFANSKNERTLLCRIKW